MSSRDEIDQRLLEVAREHLQPDEEDRARIRSLLSVRLLQASSAPPTPDRNASDAPPPNDLPPASPIGSSLDLAKAGTAAHSVWLKVLAAAALGGGLGFGAGYQAGQRAPHSPPPSALEAPSPIPEEPAQTDVRTPVVPPPVLEEPVAHREPALRQGTREAPSSVSESPKDADALYKELSLVRRAEQAIRNREPLLALGLLQELDETIPAGRLREEREAARIMALCLRDLDEQARASAHGFEAAHPHSVYIGRIRELCRFPEDE